MCIRDRIKKYYDEHKDDYRAPESLNIQFVVMSPETVKMTAEPSEQELKDFYEQNRKKYEVEESRRAAHILIAPDANEADKAKADQDAKAKAEKILAEVKADPSKFAQLAKENSADPGTAESGGDLDFFTQGQMVPEFDKAVFGAKKDEIVGPVKTEFGWHIIKVNDVKEVPFPTYDSVKDQIREGLELKKQQNFLNELMKTNKIEYGK